MRDTSIFRLFLLCFALAVSLVNTPAVADKAPAFWKMNTTGDFDTVVSNLKSGLEAAQFLLTDEEDLAKGLENNKHMLGGEYKWNTIGFKRVTAVHFCSVVFNHEAFNIDMDLSVLCPFKVVAYSMKESPNTVTIITVKPTHLVKGGSYKAKKLGKKIEKRILDAIKAGVKQEIPEK